MKKLLISLLCLIAVPAVCFENPFSMEQDEIKVESPVTFDKDRFALSSLTFLDIYAKLGFITSMAAGLYAKSKYPDTCLKDAAKLHTQFITRPGGLAKTIGAVTFWSAFCGATAGGGFQLKSQLPKVEEQPVLINKPEFSFKSPEIKK